MVSVDRETKVISVILFITALSLVGAYYFDRQYFVDWSEVEKIAEYDREAVIGDTIQIKYYFVNPRSHDLSVSIIFFGFVAASMTLTQIIFFNLVPKLKKRFKNKRLFLLIYTLIPGIAYILLAFTEVTLIGIALILLIIGVGFSRNIIFIGAINENIEEENRATVLSTISMMRSVIITILYPVTGLLVMWNLKYTFIILGISIILVALLSRVKNEHL